METKRFFRIGFWVSMALAIALLAPGIHAGTLNSDVVGMFPKGAGEFAYADLRLARQFSWFAQLKEQMLPSKFRQFEQFLTAAGMDPNAQVEELAWALVPTGTTSGGASVPTADQIVGVALGQFQPAAAQAYFKTRKTPTFNVRGLTLYAFGGSSGPEGLYFVFLDPNTVAFGQRKLVEQMIGIRYGQEENLLHNNVLYPLINQANGHGIVWAVLNPAYSRLAMQQLVPQTAQFPQAAQLLAKIQSLMISVQASTGIEADFQATCMNSTDATTLGALLSAGIMAQRYMASQNNPSLAKMLETAQVMPTGDRLAVSIALTNDQMVSLIQSRTFAVQN